MNVTETAAIELARDAITVNAVLPGPTLSDGVEAMLKGAQQASGKSTAHSGEHRTATHRS